MITKTDFVQQVIRKLMDWRSKSGVQIFYKELLPENLVIGAVPKDEKIYLEGLEDERFRTLNHTDFLNMTYEDILQEFIVISTVYWLDYNEKRMKK